MKIAMSGSSGLIGTALRTALTDRGDTVLRLVSSADGGPGSVRIDPRVQLDPHVFNDVDAVVNLAGAPVAGRRWTSSYKQTIYDSRLETTRNIVRAIQSAQPRPRVLVSASAIGVYGNRGLEVLTETSAPGDDFLARVCKDWESATNPAVSAGTRVAQLRTGLVLDRSGGTLEPLLKLGQAGLGGHFGPGSQYWSTITLADEVRAIRFILDSDSASGPFNLTGPEPVTNKAFTAALGRHLHRPMLATVPKFAIGIALGEFSSQVLASQRVLPEKLLAAGFTFDSPDVESQLQAVLGH